MDKISLSLKLRQLAIWLDGRCQPDTLIRKQYADSPFGNCYLTIDPARQGPLASSNYNRVHLCGAESSMRSNSIGGLIDLFTAADVKQFFVWLSPGPDMHGARQWLEQNGLTRVRHVRYPTLVRSDRPSFEFHSDLTVREVNPTEIANAREQLGETMWPGFARSSGNDGLVHYMAFDGDLPVAIAILCIFEDVGYLMAAATAESHRQRGAQQALIAARIRRAEDLGCTVIVSETLSILQHSYRNLQRAGFREAYEKEVYAWSA